MYCTEGLKCSLTQSIDSGYRPYSGYMPYSGYRPYSTQLIYIYELVWCRTMKYDTNDISNKIVDFKYLLFHYFLIKKSILCIRRINIMCLFLICIFEAQAIPYPGNWGLLYHPILLGWVYFAHRCFFFVQNNTNYRQGIFWENKIVIQI